MKLEHKEEIERCAVLMYRAYDSVIKDLVSYDDCTTPEQRDLWINTTARQSCLFDVLPKEFGRDEKLKPDQPHYEDGCLHVANGDTYHGSTEIDDTWYDVYSYKDPIMGIELCFRYGSEGHEYISPTTPECTQNSIDHMNDELDLHEIYTKCLEVYRLGVKL